MQRERDVLRASQPQQLAEVPSDVPTLQQGLVAAQKAIEAAYQNSNVDDYEAASARHAQLAAALARAMRQRPRC